MAMSNLLYPLNPTTFTLSHKPLHSTFLSSFTNKPYLITLTNFATKPRNKIPTKTTSTKHSFITSSLQWVSTKLAAPVGDEDGEGWSQKETREGKKKKKTLKTREKKTTNKKINSSATVTMHKCMVNVAIVQLCITAQFDTH